jgi:hypothetical protein
MSTVKSKNLQVGTDASASNNFTIYQPATPDGTLRIGVGNADNPTEIAQFTSSGLVSGVSKLDTATGSAPSYSARAWVNFNGTGTVAIRDSGNVSSITDNGNGDYDINLTTAMPDTNGSIGACAAETVGSNTGGMRVVSASFSSTTVIKVSTLYQNGQVANPAFVGVQVFR